MDGITDQPFRHIQKKYGDPMLVYTEFVSVEAICQGDLRRLRDLLYDESQRPVVAQIYGFTPEHFRQVAILLCELGFDGIDINMGCPAKNIANAGAGAGLIRQPTLAQEIVRATKQGVQDWQYGATVADCPKITPELAAEVM
ncbi:MAG: tRNA-dihydrouridine synthase, partial [Caldilineaceae bacterium]|nr:tRNA-dihydrouridine synthase [Caldilineaceae bacterium]